MKTKKLITKDIPGYEGIYYADTLGNIYRYDREWVTGRNTKRNLKGGMVAKINAKLGYVYASLSKDSCQKLVYVHRLIAFTFLPNPGNKIQVNHINGIKSDNRVENLEWCTPGENQKHAFRLGLKKPSINNRRAVTQYSEQGEKIKDWQSLKEITDTLGYDRSAIIRVCKSRQKSSYGHYWKYKN